MGLILVLGFISASSLLDLATEFTALLGVDWSVSALGGWLDFCLIMGCSVIIFIWLILYLVRIPFDNKCFLMVRLLKCRVSSSRRSIRVRIDYKYMCGVHDVDSFDYFFVRLSKGGYENHKDVAEAVLQRLINEPFLNVFCRSNKRLEKHSLLAAIRSKVPELKNASFGF